MTFKVTLEKVWTNNKNLYEFLASYAQVQTPKNTIIIFSWNFGFVPAIQTFFLCFRSNHQKYSVKKLFLKISQYTVKFQLCNVIKKRIQHRCFPVNIAKFLRTPIFKNICKTLLLSVSIGLQKPPHLCQLLWTDLCLLKTFLGSH